MLPALYLLAATAAAPPVLQPEQLDGAPAAACPARLDRFRAMSDEERRAARWTDETHGNNLLYSAERKLLLCANEKAASTTLTDYMWTQLTEYGRACTADGTPVFDCWTRCQKERHTETWSQFPDGNPCWEGKLQTLGSLHSAEARQAVLDDPAVTRFAFVRDPQARAVSGFMDKLMCKAHADEAARRKMVPALLREAPHSAPAAADGDGVACLDFPQFVRAIGEVASQRRLGALDVHLKPQDERCAFGRLAYDFLIPIEKLSAEHGKLAAPFKRAVAGLDDGLPMSAEHHDPRDGEMAAAIERDHPAESAALGRVFDDDRRKLAACGLRYPLDDAPAVVVGA